MIPFNTYQGLADPINVHISRWQRVRDARQEWTFEAFKDLQYLSGKPWTPLELDDFRSRGLEAPNYNLSLPMVNTVCGIESQNRSVLKYLPRGRADIQGAEAVNNLVRKVLGDARYGRKMSRAFRSAAGVGVGWMQMVYGTDPFKNPLGVDVVGSFDVWVDDAAMEWDYSDALDQFRAKYVRPLHLARMYPHLAAEIMMLRPYNDTSRDMSHTSDYYNDFGDMPDVGTEAWNGGYYGGPDMRIHARGERLIQYIERWYKTQVWTRYVKMLDGRVHEVPTGDDREGYQLRLYLAQAIVDQQAFAPEDSWVDKIRRACFADNLLLSDVESQFKHRELPLIPIKAYEDEYNRPFGMVRQMRTPQKDLNSRISNMLTRATTRQTFVEDGAVDDLDAFADALADPAAVVRVRDGALRLGKIFHRDNLATAPIEANMVELDVKMFADMSGVTPELRGQNSNVDSGRGILAKQSSAQTSLYTLFDNRNDAEERLGHHLLSGIQDRYTTEMDIRINETAKGIEWITINKRDPSTGAVLNDMTQASFDTEVTSVPFAANQNMAKMEALAQFVAPLPMEAKMMFAAKMAELADIPDAEEAAAKLEMFANALLSQYLGKAAALAASAHPDEMQQGAPQGEQAPQGPPPDPEAQAAQEGVPQ